MPSDSSHRDPQVIELRQYTLHPGQRDVLIELFEREFVEPQRALGAPVIGAFRDLDDPDRFVWLRGFADMPRRAQALAAFYGGPVWQRHRDAANATLVDSDNVLLLRPARSGSGFAGAAARTSKTGLVTATVCPLPELADAALLDHFFGQLHPLWDEPVACLVTDPTPNNYPRLPVREGEPMLVLFARSPDAAAAQAQAARLTASHEWHHWCERLARAPQTLRLAPTSKGALQ